jgi:hypothetical protein
VLKDEALYWTFLNDPQIPLTNNAAEVRFVDPKPNRQEIWGMGPEPKRGDNLWFENLIPV